MVQYVHCTGIPVWLVEGVVHYVLVYLYSLVLHLFVERIVQYVQVYRPVQFSTVMVGGKG